MWSRKTICRTSICSPGFGLALVEVQQIDSIRFGWCLRQKPPGIFRWLCDSYLPFILFALLLGKKKVISGVLWTLKFMPCMLLSSNILKYSKCKNLGTVPRILSFRMKVWGNWHFQLLFLPEEVVSASAPEQSSRGTGGPRISQKVKKSAQVLIKANALCVWPTSALLSGSFTWVCFKPLKMVNNASEPNVTRGLAMWGSSVLPVDGIVCSYWG